MAEILSAYKQLEEKFHKISTLSGAAAILGWDNAVMMPAGGADARAEQLATLGVISHEMLCDLQVSDLLDEAEDQPQNLSAWQLANLREMRRDWKHATAVSSDLVEALSKATSKCEMIWRQAREDNDFESLRNSLEEVVRLTKIQADVKSEAFQLSPYDALLDQYEPGCSEAQIDILFDDLEEFLPPILQQVLDRQEGATAAVAPKGPFDIEKQRKLGLHFMEKLGFDFNRGRLDISHHPLTEESPMMSD
ncbi:hypothetical protein [Sneathiella glossodoripedis]|uniref:hypothetical protein n=1 Tax=Sneathiella glossodoripedis TaxID=418853 RepID=UPI000AA1EC60|nr:hypothetical protein [Sneathiella glossodoripedis]